MVESYSVCHWKKTFWVGGCDGIGGLAYLVFCAAYWSRQSRVFRHLSRSCYTSRTMKFLGVYLFHSTHPSVRPSLCTSFCFFSVSPSCILCLLWVPTVLVAGLGRVLNIQVRVLDNRYLSSTRVVLEYNVFSIFMFIILGKTSTWVVLAPALSGWIYFIFIHLIQQLQKVCHV